MQEVREIFELFKNLMKTCLLSVRGSVTDYNKHTIEVLFI